MSLYRSEESRRCMLDSYRQQLHRLELDVGSQSLATDVGNTHVLISGDEAKPPLLVLPGLQTPAPFMLEFVAPLADKFRLFCPDMPGQVGLSCEALPDRHGGYGRWVHEVLDRLELEQVAAVGFSFGGAVLLDAAKLQPQRISRACLLMPAGISFELWRPLRHFLLPWLRYKITPSDDNFKRLMQPLMGQNWPELEAFYKLMFLHVRRISQVPPGPFKAPGLDAWQASVQLVMAQDDAYFSVDKLAADAARLLPHLSDSLVLSDTHIPSSEGRQRLQAWVCQFLSGRG